MTTVVIPTDNIEVVTVAVPGADGQGLPIGGTAGQVPFKVDDVNYNVEWGNLTGGGDMLRANNLSDLTSSTTALTNLGFIATIAELNYMGGVTSAVQAQLDGKAASSHNHDGDYQPLATVLSNTTASFTTAQETKLIGIEAGATADQTGTEIVAAVDAELGNTDWKTRLTTEEVQDIVGALFQAGSHTNMTVTYDDAAGSISLAASGGGGGLDQEQVEDIVDALVGVTGGGINVAYDDGAGTLTFSLTGESYTTAEQTKLSGIAAGATANSSDVTLLARSNHTGTQAISTVSGLQATIDGKQATITGAATTVTSSDLTASRALVSNASGKIAISAVTSTEIGYLDGVTSAIQAQLDSKQAADADTAKTDVAQEYTKAQNFNATTLTDAASIAWNLEDNQVASVTLAGNRTLAAPSNMKDGGTYILIVKQDAVGSRALTFNAAYKFSGGTAPTLSTAVNAVDIITFVSDGTSLFGVAQLDFS